VTIKPEAAYHEAGHAIMAYLSKYHLLAGPIELADYGAGEAYIGLIPSKLTSAGIEADEAAQRNPDVAKDLGRVLVAGLMAERIAAEHDPALTPNPTCAQPDYAMLVQQLAAAGLSRKYDRLETEARATLEAHWDKVEALAGWLLGRGRAEFAEVNAFIARLV